MIDLGHRGLLVLNIRLFREVPVERWHLIKTRGGDQGSPLGLSRQSLGLWDVLWQECLRTIRRPAWLELFESHEVEGAEKGDQRGEERPEYTRCVQNDGRWLRNTSTKEFTFFTLCCSDAQRPTLCNSMDCSTPGVPILYYLSPRVCSDSCPLGRWCHPTISSSVAPFSSCPQSVFDSG